MSAPQYVPVPVYIGDDPVDHPDLWTLGVEDRGLGQAWGLAYGGRLTHMCYSMDYAAPADALDRVRDLEWWHFDAGRKLRVRVADLARAFVALGVLDKEIAR